MCRLGGWARRGVPECGHCRLNKIRGENGNAVSRAPVHWFLDPWIPASPNQDHSVAGLVEPRVQTGAAGNGEAQEAMSWLEASMTRLSGPNGAFQKLVGVRQKPRVAPTVTGI